jgi:transmembrane sensor
MKDFRMFDITDFVMDEDFTRWVYENREEDKIFWDNWLLRNPDRHLMVAEARRVLESLETRKRKIDDEVIRFETGRLLQTIREKAPADKKKVIKINRSLWYAAAAVLLLLASGFWYLSLPAKRHAQEKYTYAAFTTSKHFIENINTSNKPVTITLPDNSSISLAPSSRISYSNDFNAQGTRDIYLSGEAFFNVTKNPERPFRVFANEIITKVLGTSFTVRSFEKDTVIQVIVRTGKVSVYSQATATEREIAAPHKLGGILVTPNQQLVYEKGEQKFQKILLENPVMIETRSFTPHLGYEEAPIEKVFTELSKAYDINIVYDNELMKKCTVTADLTDESFYHKLDLICSAIGARYDVIDGQVVIQSNGCK